MKKIYVSVVFALAASAAIAQIQNSNTGPLFHQTGVPKNMPHRHLRAQAPANSTQAVPSPFYVDYDFMDESYYVDSLGAPGYQRYIWDMNMNYNLANGDTSLQYAVVDYSALYDSYDMDGDGLLQSIPFNQFNSYTIDSVFAYGGHKNTSGQNDTILCKLVQLNSSGYPQTSTVLNTTSIVTNTGLSTGNDWFQTYVFGFAPAYTINNNTTKMGVMIEYHGAVADTFGLIAGFGDVGASCGSTPGLPYFAYPSHYATNSYRYDMRFNPYPANNTYYGLFPTSTGVDTYYECNGTSGAQVDGTAGGDSDNYIQNWAITVKISVGGVGFNEAAGEAVKVGQNVPNPSNGTTRIDYALKNAGKVTFSVYDIAGKLVYSNTEGNMPAGAHTIMLNTDDFNAGVYFYTVDLDGVSVTKKMTVTK